MSIYRYLAGVEDIEGRLFRKLHWLSILCVKESYTANKSRYLSLCAVVLISWVCSLARILIQGIKTGLLSFIPLSVRDLTSSGLNDHISTGNFVDASQLSRPARVVTQIIISTGDQSLIAFDLSEGETYIATASARSTLPECTKKLILIPTTGVEPPVAILIRVRDGQINQSKLIFRTTKMVGLKLFRKFGMDEIPIKPMENINPSTDRIIVGDVAVRFGTNLRDATSTQQQY